MLLLPDIRNKTRVMQLNMLETRYKLISLAYSSRQSRTDIICDATKLAQVLLIERLVIRCKLLAIILLINPDLGLLLALINRASSDYPLLIGLRMTFQTNTRRWTNARHSVSLISARS